MKPIWLPQAVLANATLIYGGIVQDRRNVDPSDQLQQISKTPLLKIPKA
jgi:hypothetical protein